MARIQLKGISKAFGMVQALDSVSFDVQDKEFFCIVGPTNAGKTTILRIIAGLEKQDDGDILFDGEIKNEIHPRERDVAMLFQNLALYPNRTAYENIATPLRIKNVPKNEVNKRVLEVAEILHITHLLDRLPKTYSGGERQRVALGRTIIRRPNVYLFDEPLSNLDALLRIEMRSELKHIQKNLGQTMIYVTHDQVEAMSMSDRLAVLHEGKIYQVSDPNTVFKKPQHIFTAGFFGRPPMSFLHGKIESNGKKLFFTSGKLIIDISKFAPYLVNHNSGIMGVRPQDVKVRNQKTGKTTEFKVEALELLGAFKVLSFIVGNDILLGHVETSEEVKLGDEVEIEVDQSKIYFFDEETGNVII